MVQPHPGPCQRTAAVNANVQTPSSSPRTCCLQPAQNRTYPNRTEHSEHLNQSQAANAAEQARTGSNAATRDLKAVPLMIRHPETALEPLSSPKTCFRPTKPSPNCPKLITNCPPNSHDLQQNTALPQDLPPEEKNSRNTMRRHSRADPILALRTPRPTQNFTTSVGSIHEVSHRP